MTCSVVLISAVLCLHLSASHIASPADGYLKDTQKYLDVSKWKSITEVRSKASEDDGTEGDDSIAPRKYLLHRELLWTDGVVPYKISPKFSKKEKKRIQTAIKHFHTISCVRWVPKKRGHKDFVEFVRDDNPLCRSNLGRVPGGQKLFLHPKCMVDTEHEMMHILGFIHEHMRLDRDCYIRIRNDLVDSTDFAILKDVKTAQKWPYDFQSIMHYPGTLDDSGPAIFGTGPYFKNQRIKPKKPNRLSEMDVWQLNTLYCKRPHYCVVHPKECDEIAEYETRCKIDQ